MLLLFLVLFMLEVFIALFVKDKIMNVVLTKELEEYLEKEYEEGQLVYGIHKSDSALMTCLIFERHGKHIHFVDSSNGGYALASKELKRRLKAKEWKMHTNINILQNKDIYE